MLRFSIKRDIIKYLEVTNNYSEIATKVNCSREYVRQVKNEFTIPEDISLVLLDMLNNPFNIFDVPFPIYKKLNPFIQEGFVSYKYYSGKTKKYRVKITKMGEKIIPVLLTKKPKNVSL